MFTITELSELKCVFERYRSTLTDDTEEYRDLVDVIRVVVRRLNETLKNNKGPTIEKRLFTVNELAEFIGILERYKCNLSPRTNEFHISDDISKILAQKLKDTLKGMGVAIASEVLEKEKTYTVFVTSPLHPEDEDKLYKQGDYDTCAEAIEACKAIIERCGPFHGDYGSPEDYFKSFAMFGDDAIIISDDPDCKFDGWDYAKQLCGYKPYPEPITES